MVEQRGKEGCQHNWKGGGKAPPPKFLSAVRAFPEKPHLHCACLAPLSLRPTLAPFPILLKMDAIHSPSPNCSTPVWAGSETQILLLGAESWGGGEERIARGNQMHTINLGIIIMGRVKTACDKHRALAGLAAAAAAATIPSSYLSSVPHAFNPSTG